MNLYDQWFHASRRKFLIRTLAEANGNQIVAAQKLGIHRNTFGRMLREDGITPQMTRAVREGFLKQFHHQSMNQTGDQHV